MGIASLILGLVGLGISTTSFKEISLIICTVGLVLGIISIVKNQNKGLAITGVVLSSLGFVLCFVFNTGNPENGMMSASGTNMATNSVSDNKKNDYTDNDKSTVSIEKIKIEKVGITKAGDLVIKIFNNNKKPVCLDSVKANFKDASGNFALKAESDSSFIVVPAEGATMTFFWGFEKDFSKYTDVQFKTEFSNISEDFADHGISVSANNTGSQIAVTLKNDSGKTIDSANVVAVYYVGNEVVGVETGYDDSKVSDGEEAYINVDYPDDSDYEDVNFDRYEVYYVNASY